MMDPTDYEKTMADTHERATNRIKQTFRDRRSKEPGIARLDLMTNRHDLYDEYGINDEDN